MNERIRGVLPFLIGLGLFFALGIFNEWRDFDLWRNYAFSGVFLGGIATYLVYRYDVRIPHYIQWVIVGATLTHYGGGSLGSPDPYRMGLLGMHGINGAYHHFDWWDHLTHGAGIGASAMGIAYLFEVYRVRRGLRWSASGVWVLTMLAALTAGVGVELYEFLGKTAFQTIDQGGYENTMRDLHFNFIGAALATALAVTLNRTHFQQRIESRWGKADLVPRERWWKHTSPGMTAFVMFCAINAAMAMALATWFFAIDVPANDLPLYDKALNALTIAAAVSLISIPITKRVHRRMVA